jgi:hypothetical protein
VRPRRAEKQVGRDSSRASTAKSTIPAIKARLEALDANAMRGSPADFGKLIADEIERRGKVIRTAGIKAE